MFVMCYVLLFIHSFSSFCTSFVLSILFPVFCLLSTASLLMILCHTFSLPLYLSSTQSPFLVSLSSFSPSFFSFSAFPLSNSPYLLLFLFLPTSHSSYLTPFFFLTPISFIFLHLFDTKNFHLYHFILSITTIK